MHSNQNLIQTQTHNAAKVLLEGALLTSCSSYCAVAGVNHDQGNLWKEEVYLGYQLQIDSRL